MNYQIKAILARHLTAAINEIGDSKEHAQNGWWIGPQLAACMTEAAHAVYQASNDGQKFADEQRKSR